jgi:hypothetical protein
MLFRGGRHLVAARMKSAVGTVFIASAAAHNPQCNARRWMSCPPGARGCRGRDEYGPYLGFSPTTVQESDAHPLFSQGFSTVRVFGFMVLRVPAISYFVVNEEQNGEHDESNDGVS